MIYHTSRQWPVGHGGFCTAEVSSGERKLETSSGEISRETLTGERPAEHSWGGSRSWPPIRYVYDCGAMRPRQLYDAIPQYLDEVAADSGVIELVILSHIDWDHVNGIRRLLSHPSVRVKRVMLPLLSPADRLLAVARSSSAMSGSDGVDPSDPGDGGGPDGPEGFELDLMLDPAPTLRGVDPDIDVIFVDGSEGNGPGLGTDPTPIDGFSALLRVAAARGDVGMIAVGAGYVKHDPHTGDNYMSDRNGVRIHETALWSAWLLAPYVSPRISARVDEFMAAVATKIGMEENELHEQMIDHERARKLVVENRKALREVYDKFGGANPSSMCLYSGPFPKARTTFSTSLPRPENIPSEIPGTLFTGDAVLKREDDVAALASHYGPLVPLVGTLHLPHHGSWRNVSAELLSELPNLHHVLAMTPIDSKGHHPGEDTMKAVRHRGLEPHLVTINPESAVATKASAS